MAQTGERKKYLDAAKGWGINMIVFGHITALGNPIDRYFATYKLAIFFFCIRLSAVYHRKYEEVFRRPVCPQASAFAHAPICGLQCLDIAVRGGC